MRSTGPGGYQGGRCSGPDRAFRGGQCGTQARFPVVTDESMGNAGRRLTEDEARQGGAGSQDGRGAALHVAGRYRVPVERSRGKRGLKAAVQAAWAIT